MGAKLCGFRQTAYFSSSMIDRMEANSANSGEKFEIIQPEFTAKEFAIAELTWAKLKVRFNNQVGMEIFRQIFASCPKVKNLFGVQNREDQKALCDQRMARHTAIFQDIIELLIVDLSQRSDSLTQSLITLGAQHWFFTQRGFRPEFWVIFGNTLVNLIRSLPLSLSQRYLARRTWIKLIVYLLDCVMFGYFQQMNEVVVDPALLPPKRESA